MGSRLDLQSLLETILGSTNVYFQPPSSVLMSYPCIRYEWDDTDTEYANNLPYIQRKRYQLVVIDKNPDSTIPDRIARLPLCKFDRHYPSNNLHHFSFNLYY